VGILDLTDGEPTPRSSGPEERAREAAAAAEVLGVAERVQLDFPNRRLFDGFEVRVALAKVFRRFRPKLVLGLGDKTPLASPDHAQAVAITEAAVFYSRLTKWDEVFDGLPVHTVPMLASYFLPTGVTDVPHGHYRWWSISRTALSRRWRPSAATPRSFLPRRPTCLTGFVRSLNTPACWPAAGPGSWLPRFACPAQAICWACLCQKGADSGPRSGIL